MLRLKFPRNYRLHFFQQGLNWKLDIFNEWHFFNLIWFFIGWKFWYTEKSKTCTERKLVFFPLDRFVYLRQCLNWQLLVMKKMMELRWFCSFDWIVDSSIMLLIGSQFTQFSTIWLIVLHKHWFDYLIQELQQSFLVLEDYSSQNYCIRFLDRNLDNLWYPKMLLSLINLYNHARSSL